MTPRAAGVEDDHKPFQERGVPIVHLIPVPFPAVWHAREDDLAHISLPAVRDISLILKIMAVEYFGLLPR
jgi:glutaminyl-peptide cyclotransferase